MAPANAPKTRAYGRYFVLEVDGRDCFALMVMGDKDESEDTVLNIMTQDEWATCWKK